MISLAVLAAGWVVVLSPGDYAILKFPPLSRHSRIARLRNTRGLYGALERTARIIEFALVRRRMKQLARRNVVGIEERPQQATDKDTRLVFIEMTGLAAIG